MRVSRLAVAALAASFAAAACGGPRSTSTPVGGASSPPSVQSTAATAQSAAPPTPASPTASASAAYDDPEEGTEPHVLAPLFSSSSLPSFPAATVEDAACGGSFEFVGDARKDYETVVRRCGAATGAVEYAHPASGQLHDTADARDTYSVRVAHGLCYRFIGVADGTIQDLDVVVTDGHGSVLGHDTVTGPVVIFPPDKAWCPDGDADVVFDVAVDGKGTGRYVFGVWARAKK